MILFLGDYAPECQRTPSRKFIDLLDDVHTVVLNYEGTSQSVSLRQKKAKGYAPRVNNGFIESLLKNDVNVVCSLTNNHSFDFGIEGYKQTVNDLAKMGCKVIGPHVDCLEIQPQIKIQLNDLCVNVLSLSDFNVGEVRLPVEIKISHRFKNIIKLLHQTPKNSNSLNICYYHTGVEYLKTPNPSLVKKLEILLSAGAEHCICHHQHVPLPIIQNNRNLLAYGLGNLAFDCATHKNFYDTNNGLAVAFHQSRMFT